MTVGLPGLFVGFVEQVGGLDTTPPRFWLAGGVPRINESRKVRAAVLKGGFQVKSMAIRNREAIGIVTLVGMLAITN